MIEQQPVPVTSYRYIVTLSTTALSDTSTQIQVSTVRMSLANGSVVQSDKMENKYLNYSVFEGVQERLVQAGY